MSLLSKDVPPELAALAAEQLAGVELRPLLEIDVDLPLEDVDWAIHALLQQLEPCGMQNPQPVLLSRNIEVRDSDLYGSGRSLFLLRGRGARI